MMHKNAFRAAILSATALVGVWGTPGFAQTAPAEASADNPADPSAEGLETIVVTGTRRSVSIQDAPINIAAVTADSLKRDHIDDVRSLAAFTPGITVQDTGPRNTGTIVLRGLSADDNSSFGDNYNNTLATYMGEIPLYQDFKFLDMDRIEVLLGPQGTLYGLGTLAGAIRYIPNRPDPDNWSGTAHGRVYGVSHSSKPGFQIDGTINIPIVPGKIAFRSTTGYYNDPGFMDYVYLVNTPGVSLAQPQQPGTFFGSIGTPDQIKANLHTYKDANFEHTFTTRNQLGIFPADWLKVYLTYAYQTTDTNGRQANGGGVFGTSKYQAPWRYLEPSKRKAHLYAAEVEADIGEIAQLVSATAITKQTIDSSVDVTDLLIDLDYGYELFPAFSGYTKQNVKYDQFNQEIRLVSKHGGPFSWVLGGFYNNFRTKSQYREIVPGYPAYAGINRPDEVEYASFVDSRTKEKAVFGELSVTPIKNLQFTGGARYYNYDAFVNGGQALPLFQTYPNINFRSRSGSTKDNGVVWKFNGSYKFSPDLMAYATYSKGYRIGGVNRVAPCVLPLPPGQNICALPNELSYQPDTTKNIEVGVRATLFGGKLRGSIAAYHIDWDGIQLAGQTVNGATGITVNGGKAVSKGVELTFTAKPFEGLTINGSYAYNDAHLTQTVPELLKVEGGAVDALAGARLPGSTKNSGSLGAVYELPVNERDSMVFNWTATYTGNILSRAGALGNGEVLPAYTVHRASITYKLGPDLEFRAYADNIFDKFAVTSVGNDLSRRIVNDGIVSRYYANNVLSPRKFGVEFTKRF